MLRIRADAPRPVYRRRVRPPHAEFPSLSNRACEPAHTCRNRPTFANVTVNGASAVNELSACVGRTLRRRLRRGRCATQRRRRCKPAQVRQGQDVPPHPTMLRIRADAPRPVYRRRVRPPHAEFPSLSNRACEPAHTCRNRPTFANVTVNGASAVNELSACVGRTLRRRLRRGRCATQRRRRCKPAQVRQGQDVPPHPTMLRIRADAPRPVYRRRVRPPHAEFPSLSNRACEPAHTCRNRPTFANVTVNGASAVNELSACVGRTLRRRLRRGRCATQRRRRCKPAQVRQGQDVPPHPTMLRIRADAPRPVYRRRVRPPHAEFPSRSNRACEPAHTCRNRPTFANVTVNGASAVNELSACVGRTLRRRLRRGRCATQRRRRCKPAQVRQGQDVPPHPTMLRIRADAPRPMYRRRVRPPHADFRFL